MPRRTLIGARRVRYLRRLHTITHRGVWPVNSRRGRTYPTELFFSTKQTAEHGRPRRSDRTFWFRAAGGSSTAWSQCTRIFLCVSQISSHANPLGPGRDFPSVSVDGARNKSSSSAAAAGARLSPVHAQSTRELWAIRSDYAREPVPVGLRTASRAYRTIGMQCLKSPSFVNRNNNSWKRGKKRFYLPKTRYIYELDLLYRYLYNVRGTRSLQNSFRILVVIKRSVVFRFLVPRDKCIIITILQTWCLSRGTRQPYPITQPCSSFSNVKPDENTH